MCRCIRLDIVWRYDDNVKFFWKIFFTVMFVSVASVIAGGFILINAGFRSQLDSEVEAAREYGEIVFYSLSNECGDPGMEMTAKEEEEAVLEAVSQVARSVSIDRMNQQIPFCVIQGGQQIFSSLKVDLDKGMVDSLRGEMWGWTLKKKGNEIYVQMIRPARFLDRLFYIETVRQVTHLFVHEKEQYRMMIVIILGMLLVVGLVTFCISKLLLRRVVALTETTRRIAEGNLQERAGQKGQDEITLLSENFNVMADRLEETICHLKEESDRKELFVGAFSHELKTPLTSIIGYADLLRQREMDEEQRQLCARYIFSEGKRLEKLSMRLLELIVLKNHVCHPEPVDIRELLDQAARMIQPRLTAAKLRLVQHVQPAVIDMEPGLMETVFLNLLDNAVKSMEREGEILLTGEWAPEGYRVTIRDFGKGMASDELPKIMDAFYMADKARSGKKGGAGLGLAICREILSIHGFEIHFDSAPGEGTAVTVLMKERGGQA